MAFTAFRKNVVNEIPKSNRPITNLALDVRFETLVVRATRVGKSINAQGYPDIGFMNKSWVGFYGIATHARNLAPVCLYVVNECMNVLFDGTL